MAESNNGFWNLDAQKQWTPQELDRAFAVFKRLKETYGDQFNLCIQDLHKDGAPAPDGTETAQIAIKIFVAQPNAEITQALKGAGLTYIE